MRVSRTDWSIVAIIAVIILSLHITEGSEPASYDVKAETNTTSPDHTVKLRTNRPLKRVHNSKHLKARPVHTKNQTTIQDDDGHIEDTAAVSDDVEDKDYEPASFTAETFFAILVTLAIVLSNCAILLVLAWTEAFSNFNKTFVYSLTFADLFIGLFITPYSIFLSVYKRWVFSSDLFCSVTAYTFTTFLAAKLYSMTWLSVDHYVAVRKPERYGVMMSPTRSFCWICFSWAVAVSFWSPPLFSFTSAFFSDSTYMCLMDAKEQIAYLLTAGVLVSLPPIVAMGITNCYLFTNSFKKRISFYEKVFVELSARPRNYHITCVLCTVIMVMWIPFGIVNMVKIGHFHLDKRFEFYTLWFGVSSCFTQFIIMSAMSQPFRDALRELCDPPNWCRRFVCCCCYQRDSWPQDVNIIVVPRKR